MTALARPVTFLHLTDLHLCVPALADSTLNGDTLASFDAVLARIAQLDPAPDFLLVTGDLTHRGDADSYRLLANRLGRVAMPQMLALGNHDRRGPFGAVIRGEGGEAPYAHEAVIAGVHVIVLDTLLPGRIAGALDEAQFAFLDRVIAARPGLPRILGLHHPPVIEGEHAPVWRHLNPADSARLARAREGQGVAGIFCGHIHVPRVSLWHGMPVVVGNGLHDGHDPLERQAMRITDARGFGLCTLRPSGLTVEFVSLPHSGHEVQRLSAEAVAALR